MNEWMNEEGRKGTDAPAQEAKYGWGGHAQSRALEPQAQLRAAEGGVEMHGFSAAGTGGRVRLKLNT